MSILIKDMNIPDKCGHCRFANAFDCTVTGSFISTHDIRQPDCPLVPIPPHGRLIDADALRKNMYHDAFETDTPMQKWDSGCWIRYKLFELQEEAAPTIIPADEEEEAWQSS